MRRSAETAGSPIARSEIITARYRIDDTVAVITLDNPPVNGLGYDTRTGVAGGIDRALGDPEVRAIVITGAGRMFSAGADIREFNTPKAKAEPRLHSLIRFIEASDKPVIAAIGGGCMGGGLELALGCHFRVAAKDAPVALPEVKLGLLPGAGGTQRLIRQVGKAKAMELCLTGRMMDAEEAERANLVARVVPAASLLDEAIKTAETIASMSLPIAMMTKEMINRAYETPLAEGIRFERRLFHSQFAVADQKEGMAAFIEKRKPTFEHR